MAMGGGRRGSHVFFWERLELGRRKERRDLLKIYVYFCNDKAAGL